MLTKIKSVMLLGVLVAVLLTALPAKADITPDAKEKLKAELQREPAGVMDLQQNTVSNLQFYTTNYGIFALNVALSGTRNAGGGFWPRNSVNQYIFGGGIWFAAKKRIGESDTLRKLCSITYNPNSGKGWYVPGRIYEKGPVPEEEALYNMERDVNDPDSYRIYFSTDYNKTTGEALKNADETAEWPIWDTNPDDTLKVNRYFGNYVEEKNERNLVTYPKGPAIISGEDIFATYKDTDLSRYEDGAVQARAKGYPLMLQMEQYIYSWGFGDYRDFIFMRYDITNYSNDTLRDCYLAPVLDVDLGRVPYTSWGAANDRTRFYEEEPELNLAVQWSDVNNGEAGFGFGYLGFDFLESPAVVNYYDSTAIVETDNQGNVDTVGWKLTLNNDKWTPESGLPMPGSLRKDKDWYESDEQLGLVTMNNWNIADDKLLDAPRYEYMARGVRDGDNGPGDKRFMMSTGPFHVLPADTFRTVVCIVLANTALGGEATGETEDMAELVRKDKFAQSVYDNNFQAPSPPPPTRFTSWKGANHSIDIRWDTNSIWAYNDQNERGLDFMGYTLYRARRYNLDTFDVNEIEPSSGYPLGKGPLGWKEIGRWQIPTPFYKSQYKAGGYDDDPNMPNIDAYKILGPATDEWGGSTIIDSMAIRVMRQPKGIQFFGDSSTHANYGHMIPIIANVDSAARGGLFPWNGHFAKVIREDEKIDQSMKTGPILYHKFDGGSIVGTNNYDIFNDIVGDFQLNPALLGNGYNPLYFKREVAPVTPEYLAHLDTLPWFAGNNLGMKNYRVGDTLHIERLDTAGVPTGEIDTVRVTLDTLYFPETLIHTKDGYMCEIETPYEVDNVFDLLRDTLHMRKVENFLYSAIQNIWINAKATTLSDFEQSKEARELIEGFFDMATNDRHFYDIGDDNKDGYVDFQEDPLKTEKLVNNMEYHYKMIAFDEGDFMQPTPRKYNVAATPTDETGRNSVTTVPRSQTVGVESSFEIISKTEDKLGSLNNFSFFPIDMQRVQQNYSGDTMRLEFEPYWDVSELTLSQVDNAPPFQFGLYSSYMRLINETDNKGDGRPDTLYSGLCSYEMEPCNFSYYDLYSETGASVALESPEAEAYDTVFSTSTNEIVRIDTITFQMRSNRDFKQRNGSFMSGDFKERGYCYIDDWTTNARGVMGFRFDFSMRQYGGALRPDTAVVFNAKKECPDVGTPVYFVDEKWDKDAVEFELKDQILITQYASWDYKNGRNVACGFNNGPGVYKVTFKEGGTEQIDMVYGADYEKEFTTTVDYLTMEVENVYSYERPDISGENVEVSYPGKLEPINLPPIAEYKNMWDLYQYRVMVSEQDSAKMNPFFETRLRPDPRNLGQVDTNTLVPYDISTNEYIGKYAVAPYAWVGRRATGNRFPVEKNRAGLQAFNANSIPDNGYLKDKLLSTNIPDQVKGKAYSGLKQNRYYLSKKLDNGEWLDFTHELMLNSCSFAFDYANTAWFAKDRSIAGFAGDFIKADEYYTESLETQKRDFQPGDVVYVGVTGGAAGMPLPGANVRFVVNSNEGNVDYTEEKLNDVRIVPNPYYISHQGQASPYDAKIYFTKLPPVCDIKIFTSSGQLISTLENNQNPATNTGVVTWDLLNNNGIRIQSQSLIAVVETPDGTSSVHNFAVVVGGFKIITDF